MSAETPLSFSVTANHLARAQELLDAGHYKHALQSFTDALAANPQSPIARCGQGKCFFRLGDLAGAREAFETALALNPRYADAECCLGSVLGAQGNSEAAIRHFNLAIELDPSLLKARVNVAVAYAAIGAEAEALVKLNEVIDLEPTHQNARMTRGTMAAKQANYHQAIEDFSAVLALHPHLSDAHYQLGLVFQQIERFADAVEQFNQAINLGYKSPEMYAILSYCYKSLKLLSKAHEILDSALALWPENFEVVLTKGLMCTVTFDLEKSFTFLKRAEAIDANHYRVLLGLGCYYYLTHNFPAAEEYLRRAHLLEPGEQAVLFQLIDFFDNTSRPYLADELIEKHIDLSLKKNRLYLSEHYLCNKNFRQGFTLYEEREQEQAYQDIPLPELQKHTPLSSLRILVVAEQGFGDAIMFSRFMLPLLLKNKVTFLCDKRLIALMGTLHPQLKLVYIVNHSTAKTDFDFKTRLMSIPYLLSLEADRLETARAYLSVNNDKYHQWLTILPNTNMKRIGLSWSGNPKFKADSYRSLPLKTLIPFLPNHFQYVVLQKDIRESDKPYLAEIPNLINQQDLINDFSDAAALCMHLDLIITIDSAPAHLAGALGKPVWLLLNFPAEWRWFLKEETSLWYPAMRLIRSPAADWSSALERIKAGLLKWQATGVQPDHV